MRTRATDGSSAGRVASRWPCGAGSAAPQTGVRIGWGGPWPHRPSVRTVSSPGSTSRDSLRSTDPCFVRHGSPSSTRFCANPVQRLADTVCAIQGAYRSRNEDKDSKGPFFSLQECRDDNTGDEHQRKQVRLAARMMTLRRLEHRLHAASSRLDHPVRFQTYLRCISTTHRGPRPFPGIPENYCKKNNFYSSSKVIMWPRFTHYIEYRKRNIEYCHDDIRPAIHSCR